ncbi:MAG: GTP-binding protein [Sedimentisphaerales bacterium]|nr:GTP-binding protein [Sedimentisphaerales bacterium]
MTSTCQDCIACVTTGKGNAAIATIKLFGTDALALLKALFVPVTSQDIDYNEGRILTGRIVDGARVIDQVVVGIEGPNILAVHCHGNPLIIEGTMELLQRHGAHLVDYEPILANYICASTPNRIVAEVQIEQLKSITIEGIKILAEQVYSGLTAWCNDILKQIDHIDLDQLRQQCDRILEQSRIAALIIHGCKTAIVGPPNSGKSTLLNALAGRDLAIVTDTAGTTRDYVTATCRIQSLRLELFDTAGLDPNLADKDKLESTAQEQTRTVIQQADLLLLVIDASQPWKPFDLSSLHDKPILLIFNKNDLGCKINKDSLQLNNNAIVKISAKQQTGIEQLVEAIQRISGVFDFDPKCPIVFTDRQKQLLQALAKTTNRTQTKSLLNKLFNG